jgi:hypothetical protein
MYLSDTLSAIAQASSCRPRRLQISHDSLAKPTHPSVSGRVPVGYHWLGISICAIGIIVFMLYELLTPPPRYGTFGPEQIQQAVDNRFGVFGKTYREDESLSNPSRKV